ncbi:hypothetical protein [Streptomyces sp. NPDC086010]|uniref:hypothetical protein n=1 Tax=Streptomyces sp. NPDC086010 TaxID=3365745 RepID=UPI0037D234E4
MFPVIRGALPGAPHPQPPSGDDIRPSTLRRTLPTAVTAAAALLALAPGAQAADTLPSGRLFTGKGAFGAVTNIDYSAVGVCRNLPARAWSFDVLAKNDVDVFFNADCRKGAPDKTGDLYYRTGTFGAGDFPWAAVSYRVRPADE